MNDSRYFLVFFSCLRIKEHNHGHDSALICDSLVNLAGILAALKAADALEYAEKALRFAPSLSCWPSRHSFITCSV